MAIDDTVRHESWQLNPLHVGAAAALYVIGGSVYYEAAALAQVSFAERAVGLSLVGVGTALMGYGITRFSNVMYASADRLRNRTAK
jgi:hypothetical protein